MQLVVVMAVKKAVSAATATFTAISTIRFLIRHLPSRLVPAISFRVRTASVVAAALVAAGQVG